MSLPSSGIAWKNYRNVTPTFQLTPLEKPDSSPFLVHMTGKNSLIKILRGENLPEGKDIPERSGFIKSSIPAFDTSVAFYNSKVVCFTESPVFALDFFRYRSFRRWANDQQFGIGFSKEELIKHKNVRPVIYLDTETNRRILTLCNKAEKNEIQFSTAENENNQIRDTVKSLKPLLFPLLENEIYQGFMWEREWRYPFEDGLQFQHNSIKVICCPNAERNGIEEILGDLIDQIDIIESWREYDEVTNYLKRRSSESNSGALDQIEGIRDIETLRDLKEKNDQTWHALTAYYEVFKGTVDQLEASSINETIESIKIKSEQLSKRITELIATEKEIEEKKKTQS